MRLLLQRLLGGHQLAFGALTREGMLFALSSADGAQRSSSVRPNPSADAQRLSRESCAVHTGADLGERFLARGRGVVAEGREPAVIGRAELLERNVLRRLQHPVANFFGCFDLRIDWRDDADEDLLIGRKYARGSILSTRGGRVSPAKAM